MQNSDIGKFDGLLLEHFFESVAASARMNLHMSLKYGKHPHHIAETLFKGFARLLSQAASRDARVKGIPSTQRQTLKLWPSRAAGPLGPHTQGLLAP